MLQKRMVMGTWIMAYLCLLLIAECAVTYNLKTGMVIHGGVLFALLLHGAITENTIISNMYTSLSIAPLIRILSLCIPLMHFENILWFAIVSIPLFIAIFTCIHILHIDGKSVGLTTPSSTMLRLEGAIIISAIPLGWMEYQLLKPAMLVDVGTSWIVPVLIFIVCTGFLEELLFRGLLQHTFTEAMGARGIFTVSVIFGILHLGNSWFDCLFAGMVGVMFALVVKKTGSIYGVTISHGLINIVLFLVMPYLALSG
jgi:membrane protease YdiL (CAAX protease family)